MGMPNCNTCRFWAEEPDFTELLVARGKRPVGECRRHAPTLTVRNGDGQSRTRWPMTTAAEGCGDHQAAHLPDTSYAGTEQAARTN